MKTTNQRLSIHRSDGKANRKRKRGPKQSAWSQPLARRANLYGKAGVQLAADVALLRRFINTEVHYIDVSSSAAAVGTAATFVLLNGCISGDGPTNRTGTSIKLDGVAIRFAIAANPLAAITYSRVMVVLDKQTNGAIFGIADILSNVSTANLQSFSQYVPESKDRFRVLFDSSYKHIALDQSQVILQESNLAIQSHIDFLAGSNLGTVADITSNSVYLLYMSNQGVNSPSITYYCRTWFIDN